MGAVGAPGLARVRSGAAFLVGSIDGAFLSQLGCDDVAVYVFKIMGKMPQNKTAKTYREETQRAAQKVVNILLESPPPTKWGRRVTIRTPSGETVPGDWNGYWDLRPMGGELRHSVGMEREGAWSHGLLPAGHEIVDKSQIPSYDDWKWEEEARNKETTKNLAAWNPQPT